MSKRKPSQGAWAVRGEEALGVHGLPAPSARLLTLRAQLSSMDEAELVVLSVLIRQRLAEIRAERER